MFEAKNLVLVEEDEFLREELARQLRADGHRVVTLEDGLELCDYLGLVLYSNGKIPPPQLIISDVELAGFGGLHICRMLSRAEDAVPIILLAMSEEGAEDSGALCVLNKSVEPGELHEAIVGYLDSALVH